MAIEFEFVYISLLRVQLVQVSDNPYYLESDSYQCEQS